MTWRDLLGLTLVYGGLNWLVVEYFVRRLKPVTPIDPRALARVADPLDAALTTEIAKPGALSRGELRFLIAEARNALVAAGGPPWEPPKPAKVPPPSDDDELTEVEAARRALEADRWFSPLVTARDTISEHTGPKAPLVLVMAVLCILDAVILVVHRARYQDPATEHATAELLTRLAGHLNTGGGDEPAQS